MQRKVLITLALMALSLLGVSSQKTHVSTRTFTTEMRQLFCTFTDPANQQTRLSGAVFYLNGTDVRTNLTTGEFSEGDGEITFTMRQELEGEYTCYAGGSCPGVCEARVVVATPSANNSIPLYYLKKVGESVTMICGVRQGLLASHYTAEWLTNQEAFDVENSDTYSGRVGVIREELKDYSLTISPLRLTDSTEYQCIVKIEIVEGDPHYVRNPAITLQVYQEPVINFLSSNQTHSVNGSQPLSISFICNATGSPNLHINWIHNGIPIPSDSLDFTSTSHSIGNNGRLSELQVTRSRLGNSGEISCEASISYHKDFQEQMGELIINSRKITRSLVILDSSMSPLVFPTTYKDLLIWIDIPEGVTFPTNTLFRLKTTPLGITSDVKPIEFTIDDVFFENSRVYGFVPASRLKYSRFSVQVAVLVDGVIGPFSPEDDNVTHLHIVDFDVSSETQLSDDKLDVVMPSIIVPLSVTLIFGMIAGFIIASSYIQCRKKQTTEKFNNCGDILKLVEKRLHEEEKRDPKRLDKIDQLVHMTDEILGIRKKLLVGDIGSYSRMSRFSSQTNSHHDSGYTTSRSSSTDGSISVCPPKRATSREYRDMPSVEEEVEYIEEVDSGPDPTLNHHGQDNGAIKADGGKQPHPQEVVHSTARMLHYIPLTSMISDENFDNGEEMTEAELKKEAEKRIRDIRNKIRAARREFNHAEIVTSTQPAGKGASGRKSNKNMPASHSTAV